MTKKEYMKQQELIRTQYGKDEYDANGMPINDSAKRLVALKLSYEASVIKQDKLKVLKEEAKEAEEIKAVEIPDYLARPEWLQSFTEDEKQIALEWLKNTKQTPKEIAIKLDKNLAKVKAVFSLEAFNIFRVQICRAYINSIQPEVVAGLIKLVNAKTESVALKACEILAHEFGILKQVSGEEKDNSALLSLEKAKELEELGNQLRKLKKDQTS